MKKIIYMLCAGILALMAVAPAAASEQVTYISQPEKVTIFLNGVVLVHDTLTLAGDTDVQVILPDQIYPDTLVLRENGGRVPLYTMNRSGGPLILKIPGSSGGDVREITLDYLASGMGWKPNYDMVITPDEEVADVTVQFAFFAEIQNSLYTLDDVDVTLAAGRVDTSGQVSAASTVTANQYIAGYDTDTTSGTLATGAVTIQHLYPLGVMDAAPGDTVYTQIVEKALPARRVLLWNAQTDRRVTVIYKVRNDSTAAFAEGIVRSYEGDLFIGSDFVEFTPVGSEGSVTVGSLQDIRVNRAETRTYIEAPLSDRDYLHQVTLTMSNFSDSPVTIEVVDSWPPEGQDFVFSDEPTRDIGNLFRWTVTISAGETITITYEFRSTY